MLWVIFLSVVTIFLIQVFIALKLRDRFCDLDRRFEKIDAGLLNLTKLENSLSSSTLEVQNTTCLTALGLNYPVFMGGWSIDSFLARWLMQHLLEHRPKCIVELGSGSSTSLIARTMILLEENDVTHIAVDHEDRFLKITHDIAKLNNVASSIEFIHAPLSQYESFNMLWYDSLAEKLKGKKIDLLIIDGPPGALQPLSRYPAVPELKAHLNDHCTIVLDDANRSDEEKIAQRWVKENPSFSLEVLPAGHGLAVLSR